MKILTEKQLGKIIRKKQKDWEEILTAYTVHIKLSEEFLREFVDEINWYSVTRHQKLSEEFIREFKDFIIWKDFCWMKTVLSEECKREFKEYIDEN